MQQSSSMLTAAHLKYIDYFVVFWYSWSIFRFLLLLICQHRKHYAAYKRCFLAICSQARSLIYATCTRIHVCFVSVIEGGLLKLFTDVDLIELTGLGGRWKKKGDVPEKERREWEDEDTWSHINWSLGSFQGIIPSASRYQRSSVCMRLWRCKYAPYQCSLHRKCLPRLFFMIYQS